MSTTYVGGTARLSQGDSWTGVHTPAMLPLRRVRSRAVMPSPDWRDTAISRHVGSISLVWGEARPRTLPLV